MTTRRVPWAARIDPEVADRVRSTVTGLQQSFDPGFTAGRFTEQALVSWCERMEAEFNAGQRWPHVDAGAGLRPGARINPV